MRPSVKSVSYMKDSIVEEKKWGSKEGMEISAIFNTSPTDCTDYLILLGMLWNRSLKEEETSSSLQLKLVWEWLGMGGASKTDEFSVFDHPPPSFLENQVAIFCSFQISCSKSPA